MIARTAASCSTGTPRSVGVSLEAVWRRGSALQEATLLQMVARARQTEFGRTHGFHAIRSAAAYQERVPLRTYLEFGPLWARAAGGETDVAWPDRPRHWVKTSGTTAGEKFIPVTPEAFSSHRKGGWDAFLLAAARVGAGPLLGGPSALPGWEHDTGAARERLPPGRPVGPRSSTASPGHPEPLFPGSGYRFPSATGNGASSPSHRTSRPKTFACSRGCRPGSPSCSTGWRRPGARRAAPWTPSENAGRISRSSFTGGVHFAPYLKGFEERMGRPIHRIEVYPASEGFVAVQTEPSDGLTLMLDYGIFYEFVPIEDLGSDRP